MTKASDFIPGGIKPTDSWHHGTNDNTCSRCREPIPDDDGPLLLWTNDGHDMLAYCEKCLGIQDHAEIEEPDRPPHRPRGLAHRTEDPNPSPLHHPENPSRWNVRDQGQHVLPQYHGREVRGRFHRSASLPGGDTAPESGPGRANMMDAQIRLDIAVAVWRSEIRQINTRIERRSKEDAEDMSERERLADLIEKALIGEGDSP